MAVTLPTFTVPDATAQTLLAAFDGHVDQDGVPISAIAAYKKWLRTQLLHYVQQHEAQARAVELGNQLAL